MKIAQKLKELITSGGRVFGTTPSGSDWCVKALHPSDPMCEVRGVPDESSFPSVMMNYQSTFVLGATAGATGTWSFDAQLVPHPVNMMSFSRTDSVGTTVGSFLNSQLDAPLTSHWAKYTSLNHFAKRWRLAYMAVTVYQDGPDLANQGTVVACQRPVAMRHFSLSSINSGHTSWRASYDVAMMTSADMPNYEVSQNMPNAYFNRSREGVYMPLKLTPDSRRWRSVADDFRYSSTAAVEDHGIVLVNNGTGSEADAGYPFGPSYVDNLPIANTALKDTQAVQAAGVTNGYYYGEQTSAFLNEIWGDISVRNVSVGTSFSFFVRMGLEVQVAPSSELSPHQKLSPPLDRVALDSYSAVSRELKDAYPADFNDLGKIWTAISTAAKAAAPFLNFIPEIGPILSLGVEGVALTGDLIKASLTKKKSDVALPVVKTERNPQPAAAAVERAQAQRAAVATLQASVPDLQSNERLPKFKVPVMRVISNPPKIYADRRAASSGGIRKVQKKKKRTKPRAPAARVSTAAGMRTLARMVAQAKASSK
jgi:hypothetical protein